MQAELESIAKKHGFADFNEYDDVAANISMVMAGIDPQTKAFTEPKVAIQKEIDEVKADKSIPEKEKKQMLDELAEALKIGAADPVPGQRRAGQEVLRQDRRGAAVAARAGDGGQAGGATQGTRPAREPAEVEVERRDGHLVLTLARPERRNSLSEAMLAALQACDRRRRAGRERARGRDRRQGHRLLRRPRPQGADRASRTTPTAAAPTSPRSHAPVLRS